MCNFKFSLLGLIFDRWTDRQMNLTADNESILIYIEYFNKYSITLQAVNLICIIEYL